MKKNSLLIKLYLCLCILALCSFRVYATQLSNEVPVIPNEVYAEVITDSGEKVQIVGYKVDGTNNRSVYNLNNDIINAGYEFNINAVENDGELVIQDTVTDTSYSVTIYLELVIKHKNNFYGDTLYLLNNVNGYWGTINNTVSVEEAELRYGCTGINVTDQVVYTYVDNYFDEDTGFTTYADPVIGRCGADLYLDMLMGTTRRWTVHVPFSLYDNGIEWDT